MNSKIEMEKALVAGELESEQEKLAKEEEICDHLKERIIDLEEDYIKQREIVGCLATKFSVQSGICGITE